MSMTSSRPYIIRALYEWIVDNDCTPYILVDASGDQVEVPQQYVKDGQIVLNVSPVAVVGLNIDNAAVQFNGRFGGQPMDIYAPVGSVLGIYARENGQGMLFEPEEPPPAGPEDDGPDSSPSAGEQSPKNKPGLRVVK